jgi:long-chain acyl-CoA synthetase
VPFGKLLEIGEKSSTLLRPPTPDDVAIIMYTSGSGGVPKGVILTHANMVSACMACCSISCDILGEDRSDDEAYIAYLPLAHIFELTLEIIVLLMGIRVGYSGPNTLTDMGTMIKKGQKGDATTLCPTAMAAVPVILDRIYKGIRAKVHSRGYAFNQLFEMLYEYRLRWIRRGFDTPIINRLVFAKMRAALGGKLRLIVGG